MGPEIQQLWHEVQDLHSTALLWQMAAIAASLLFAWLINGLLHAAVLRRVSHDWQAAGVDAINRVLFPLSALLFVHLGQLVLRYWQNTGLLQLASALLLALAIIRLAVYALRYTFAPGGWLRSLENLIAGAVWLVLVLHLTRALPGILALLDGVKIGVGDGQVSLLLILHALLIILVTLVVALWISRLIENRLLGASRMHMNLRVVLGKVVRILITLFAILLALSAVGMDITLLSVFGGALGVGLGFGLQKIASNYVSGFIILLDDSIHIGDYVTIENHYGNVRELRSRYMVLRKADNTKVIIPNETLVTSVMLNHTMADRNVRLQLAVRVGYDTDLDFALALLQEIAAKQERVLRHPAPAALLHGFSDGGIDLLLNLWINDPENGTAGLQSEVYLDIWRAFKQHGISIPYPQREIRLLDGAAPGA